VTVDANKSDEIRTLARAEIEAFPDAFVAIASDQPGEYWTATHFLHDLPGKWSLSFAVWSDGLPVAYAVLSAKGPKHAHLHHFMVTAARRGSGLGARMAVEMERRIRDRGFSRLTLKTVRSNPRSLQFYERLGYHRLADDGDYAVLEKKLMP
jgi:GNAT superfamily N-acetyltransferase